MLGSTQTLAWASSYYLPAILAAPMARDLSISTAWIFAAFSGGLLVAGMAGPLSGRLIDRYGGHRVLSASSVLFAAGLLALGSAQGAWSLAASWSLIGAGMGSGLYEAGFSTLARIYGAGARRSITGITLIAGFASTVGWPLTAWMEARWGWRGACFAWAAAHLLAGFPINALLPRRRYTAASVPSGDNGSDEAPPRAAMYGLAFVFACTWFIAAAMAAHLPRLLQAAGASLTVAVAAGALIGPAQVAARVLEFWLMRRVAPIASAQVAALAHPVGAGVLLAVGAPAAAVFALIHGAGNGVMTIANGTLPLWLFGPHGYGRRQGWLMLPARFVQAAAPVVFDLLIAGLGIGALGVTAGIGLASFGVLNWLGRRRGVVYR